MTDKPEPTQSKRENLPPWGENWMSFHSPIEQCKSSSDQSDQSQADKLAELNRIAEAVKAAHTPDEPTRPEPDDHSKHPCRVDDCLNCQNPCPEAFPDDEDDLNDQSLDTKPERAEHSPLPWVYTEFGEVHDSNSKMLFDVYSSSIPIVFSAVDDANGRFIVTAVNSRAALLAEVERLKGSDLLLRTLRPKLADCEAALQKERAENERLKAENAKYRTWWTQLQDSADSNILEHVEAFKKRVAEAESERDELLAALKKHGSCSHCSGSGTIHTECTLCGDSTYDHYCNDVDVECPVCNGERYQRDVLALIARIEARKEGGK